MINSCYLNIIYCSKVFLGKQYHRCGDLIGLQPYSRTKIVPKNH
jgi:hypothetical protein